MGFFFNDNANIHNYLDDYRTTVKLGATSLHFVWDHGRRKRHFMNQDSRIPELDFYMSHGYLNAFCTLIHKLVKDTFHYSFTSAFSIDPHTKKKYNVSNKPTIISYYHCKLDEEETIHEWYHPATN